MLRPLEFLSVIVAPGMTAPEGSITAPCSRPVVSCANRPAPKVNTNNSKAANLSLTRVSRFLFSIELLRTFAAAARREVPSAEQRRRAHAVGRRGKNRLYAAQQRDRRHLRTRTVGGNDHHRVFFLQIAQGDGRQAADHLLEIHSSAGPARSASRTRRGAVPGGGRSSCRRCAPCPAASVRRLSAASRSPFQNCRDPLCQRRRQLAHLGISADLHHHRLFSQNVFYCDRVVAGVYGCHRSRDVAEAA